MFREDEYPLLRLVRTVDNWHGAIQTMLPVGCHSHQHINLINFCANVSSVICVQTTGNNLMIYQAFSVPAATRSSPTATRLNGCFFYFLFLNRIKCINSIQFRFPISPNLMVDDMTDCGGLHCILYSIIESD